MLAAGGYPWTVVPVEQKNTYMETLETASVEGDIAPLARFIGQLVKSRGGMTAVGATSPCDTFRGTS